MTKYLRVYRTLLGLNFSSLVAYRGNFVNNAIGSFAWAVFSVASILLLTAGTSRIFTWTRGELLILTGVYSVVIGMFHVMFSKNFDRFARIVHLGQLDGILLKPIDSQFLLSFYIVNYSSIPRVLVGIFFVFYLVKTLGQTILLYQVGQFFILATVGLSLLYAFWFLILTTTIWHSHLTNLVDLLYEFTGIAKYPQEMFQAFKNYLFLFLLPLTLIVSLPTKAVLSRLSVFDEVLFVSLAIAFLLVARFFWRFALRFYTSASS